MHTVKSGLEKSSPRMSSQDLTTNEKGTLENKMTHEIEFVSTAYLQSDRITCFSLLIVIRCMFFFTSTYLHGARWLGR